MKRTSVILFALFVIAACKSPQPATSATEPAATAAANASPQITGKWKVTAFEITKAPAELTQEVKKQFEAKMVETGMFQFNADGTYTSEAVEGKETGKWTLKNRTITIVKDGAETNELHLKTLTQNEVKGEIFTPEGTTATVQLARIP